MTKTDSRWPSETILENFTLIQNILLGLTLAAPIGPVNVEIIKRTEETEAADGVYGVMDSIIASCRPDLAEVTIGLACRYGWKPNADGFLRAGFCKKRGDLDRALDAFDFVILLNAEAWPEMTEPERRRR